MESKTLFSLGLTLQAVAICLTLIGMWMLLGPGNYDYSNEIKEISASTGFRSLAWICSGGIVSIIGCTCFIAAIHARLEKKEQPARDSAVTLDNLHI
jgi:hypothetical protein